MSKNIKISQLPSAADIGATDIMEVSQDLHDGTYVSRKVTIVDLTSPNVNNITPNAYNAVTKTYSDTVYYITTNDDYIRVASTPNGKYDVFLPTASGSGKVYIIKNVGKKNNTVNTDIFLYTTDASDLIDSQFTSLKVRFGECIQIVDGATNSWEIISKS